MTILRRRKRFYMHGEPDPLDLSETNLSGAELGQANLTKARLTGADLSEADLSGADLSGALLSEADPFYRYREADLSGAYLPGARLTGARLTGAVLSGAVLFEVRSFLYADLTQEQLEQAEGDENTQLPPHLKPPAHWGVKADEQPEED
jgi:uncharacterized protein YjbI with pentapeptide repeats